MQIEAVEFTQGAIHRAGRARSELRREGDEARCAAQHRVAVIGRPQLGRVEHCRIVRKVCRGCLGGGRRGQRDDARQVGVGAATESHAAQDIAAHADIIDLLGVDRLERVDHHTGRAGQVSGGDIRPAREIRQGLILGSQAGIEGQRATNQAEACSRTRADRRRRANRRTIARHGNARTGHVHFHHREAVERHLGEGLLVDTGQLRGSSQVLLFGFHQRLPHRHRAIARTQLL